MRKQARLQSSSALNFRGQSTTYISFLQLRKRPLRTLNLQALVAYQPRTPMQRTYTTSTIPMSTIAEQFVKLVRFDSVEIVTESKMAESSMQIKDMVGNLGPPGGSPSPYERLISHPPQGRLVMRATEERPGAGLRPRYPAPSAEGWTSRQAHEQACRHRLQPLPTGIFSIFGS